MTVRSSTLWAVMSWNPTQLYGVTTQTVILCTLLTHDPCDSIMRCDVTLRSQITTSYIIQTAHTTQLAVQKETKKQTPWPLVRERTIPTDRPPLVDEI
jgi:hypothetical protein